MLTLDDQGIGEIDAGSMNSDEHLAGAGNRVGPFFDRQHFWWTILIANNGFHCVATTECRRSVANHLLKVEN